MGVVNILGTNTITIMIGILTQDMREIRGMVIAESTVIEDGGRTRLEQEL